MSTINDNLWKVCRVFSIFSIVASLFIVAGTGLSTEINKERSTYILRKDSKWHIDKDGYYSIKYYLILKEQNGNVFQYEIPYDRLSSLHPAEQIVINVTDGYVIDNSIGECSYSKFNSKIFTTCFIMFMSSLIFLGIYYTSKKGNNYED